MNASVRNATPLQARSMGAGGRVALPAIPARGNDRLHVPELQSELDEFGNSFVPNVKAALAYASAGWYLGPVRSDHPEPRMRKHPGSVLGKNWHHQTSRDPDVIANWFIGTTYGIFLHVGRSGAVVLDVDHPENLPPELVFELIATTPPRQTTRVAGTDTLQGHYLFAQPADRLIGNGLGTLGAGWGDVRGANGVIVVAPTVHAEAHLGGHYAWRGIGDVPALPAALAARLPSASPAVDAADDKAVSAALRDWNVAEHPWALKAVADAWETAMRAGESRHNTAVKLAAWVSRDARAALYPLRQGFEVLGTLFRESMATTAGSGRVERPAVAASEWAGIVAWSVGQGLGEPAAEIALRRERAGQQAERFATARSDRQQQIPGAVQLPPGSPGSVGTATTPGPGEPATPIATAPDVTLLPAGFWAARPVLEHIRTAARSRLVSPDVVLGGVLARIAAFVPPTVRIDAGLGPASLNFYLAAIGNTANGKSRGMRVARDLLARPAALVSEPDSGREPCREVELGSGEGVAETFMGNAMTESGEHKANGEPKLMKVRRVVRHHALFKADEGELLTKLSERSGSTLGTVLRTAWNGDDLGQANATVETRRHVPEGQYSLAVVAGFQPSVIAPLFGEAQQGTPGRFIYLRVNTPDTPDIDNAPAWPGPLEGAEKVLRHLHEPLAGVPGAIGPEGVHLGDPHAGTPLWRCLDVEADEIRRTVYGEIHAVQVGSYIPEPMDGHRPLHLLKLAGLLALLDGRTTVVLGDWQLGEVVWATSRTLRTWLVEHVRSEAASVATARREAAAGTTARGAELVELEREHRFERRIGELAASLGRRAWRDGTVQHSAARRLLRADWREHYDAVAELAIDSGWITVGADQVVSAGPERPPAV